jgi:hypothetical protein
MAGLLDFLNTPEASMGLGLMAAGGPTTDPNAAGFGASLARGVQMGRAMEDQQTDKALKQAYLQGQIDAQKRAEREYADRKAAGQFYYGALGAGQPGATPAAQPGLLAHEPGQAGAPSAGGGSPTGGIDLSLLSAKQIIALQFAAKQAGAPDPIEAIKLARPDMQVSGGYAYDKNRVQPGFLPSLNVSANGQVTGIGVDQRTGAPFAFAPSGANDVMRDQERVRAGFRPTKFYNPVTGREEWTTEGEIADRAGGARPAPAIGGNYGVESNLRGIVGAPDPIPAEAAKREIARIEKDLATKNIDPASRAMLEQESQRLRSGLTGNSAAIGVAPASGQVQTIVAPAIGNFAAGPSAAEQAQQEAAKTKAVKTAEGEVSKEFDKQKALNSGNDMLQIIDKVLNHPGRETATGTSSALDPRNYMPGTQARNFRVALDQLKGQTFLQAFTSLKGAGAITEQEGAKAEAAISRLDTAQSDDEFKNAIIDLKNVVERGLKVARGEKVPDAPLPTAGGIPSGWTVKVN